MIIKLIKAFGNVPNEETAEEEEEGVVGKRKVFKTVHWRSVKMNELISQIDFTLEIKRFYKGKTE